MARPQSVSKFIAPNLLESEVKPFKNSGGAYIPVPQALVGRRVEVLIKPKSNKKKWV